jgi:putative methyltransferase (TIGR04325 family)
VAFFKTWEEAANASTGWSEPAILEAVQRATRKVQSGEAAAERDSVLLPAPEYQLGVMAGLLRAMADHREGLTVLDFGGSLGSLYRQCKMFCPAGRIKKWNVVEQSNFVAAGKAEFESTELRFFESIGETLSLGRPDVVVLSGVLSYVPRPYDLLEELMSLCADTLILDRTPCIEASTDLLAVHSIAPEIYDASFPSWIFSRGRLLEKLHSKCQQISEFQALDPDSEQQNWRCRCLGWLFDTKP